MRLQIVFLVLFSIFLLKSYSQITFESGYFINDSSQKTDCFIKNIEWRNNPTEFEYKLTLEAAIQKANISNVKEFGINGISKYIKALVNIDRSSNTINEMSSEKNPIFKEELLFLKVLIEGKASLYLYENRSLTRFFFKTEELEISQLVYKQYLVKDQVAQNNHFRQQLYSHLKCQNIASQNIKYLKYYEKDLMKFIIKYNECTDADFINYESTQRRDYFNLSIRPGVNLSNLNIQNSLMESSETDYGNKFSFRFGTELEFILPYNKSKWAIILEPTYQYYRSENYKEKIIGPGDVVLTKVNYQSIELPIGFKHYFYFNDHSKIFVNISYVFDFAFNSSIESSIKGESLNEPLEINSTGNFAFGLGYKFKDRYSMEIRYQTAREVLHSYSYWYSDYKTLSLLFGYTIF